MNPIVAAYTSGNRGKVDIDTADERIPKRRSSPGKEINKEFIEEVNAVLNKRNWLMPGRGSYGEWLHRD